MPTGYTADVGEGKVTDFRTFALRCARAFGACIMQRDDDARDEPKHREPTDYHAKAIARLQPFLEKLRAMNADDAERESKAEYAQAMIEWSKSVENKNASRARYEAMISAVEAWTPPTKDHEEYKAFMLQQLRDSIKWDCTIHDEYRPVQENALAWLHNKTARATSDIAYHEKEHAEELQRCTAANAWIDALCESIK